MKWHGLSAGRAGAPKRVPLVWADVRAEGVGGLRKEEIQVVSRSMRTRLGLDHVSTTMLKHCSCLLHCSRQ